MTAMGISAADNWKTLDRYGRTVDTGVSNTQHFADVLAAAATSSNTNVTMMGETFKFAASIAGTLGFSIEDVALATGLMANNGIKSGKAGRSLMNIMKRMSDPPKACAETMAEYNLTLTDGEGNMKSFRQIMLEMREATQDMDETQKVAFASAIAGSTGMQGLLGILNASEAEWNQLAAAVDSCTGSTKQMADTMLNNAPGAVTIFRSAVEGLQISLYDLYEDSIVKVVEGATALVDAFRNMDENTKRSTVAFAGFLAALGPVVKGVGLMIPLLPMLISPMGTLAVSLGLLTAAAADFATTGGGAFETAAGTMEAGSSRIGAALRALIQNAPGKLAQFHAEAKKYLSGLTPILKDMTSALAEMTEKVWPQVVSTLAETGASVLTAITGSIGNVTDVGFSLISGLVTGILNSLPSLVKAGADTLSALMNAFLQPERYVKLAADVQAALLKAFTQTDWAGAGRKMADSVSSALTAITRLDFAAIGQGIQNTMAAAAAAAKDTLTAVLGEEATFLTIGQHIAGWIQTGLATLSGALMKLILGDQTKETSSWQNAGAKIGEAVQKGMGSLKDLIRGLLLPSGTEGDGSWVSAGSAIAAKIQEGLGSLSGFLSGIILGNSEEGAGTWVDAGTRIANGIREGFSALGEFLKGLVLGEEGTWQTAGASIGKALAEGMTGLGKILAALITGDAEADWPKVGTAIWTAIQSGFTAGGAFLAAFFTGAVGEAADSVKSQGTAIWQSLQTGIINARVQAKSFLTSLILGSNEETGAAEAGKTVALRLTSGIAAAIPETVGAVNLLGALLSGIFTDTKEMATFASSFASGLMTALAGYDWSALAESLGNLGNTLLTGIANGITAAAAGAAQIAVSLAGVLTSVKPEELAGAALSISRNILDAVISGIAGVADAGGKMAGALTNLLTAGLAGGSETLNQAASHLVTGILNGMTTIREMPQVKTLLTNIIAAMEKSMANLPGLLNIASTLAGGIFSAGVDLTAGAAAFAKRIIAAVAGTDWSAAGTSLQKLGDTILSGIATGITASAAGIAGIAAAISAGLSSIDGKAFATAMTGLGKSLVGALVSSIGAAADAGASIAGAFASLLNRAAGGGAKEFGKAAAAIADTVLKGIAAVTEMPQLTVFMTNLGTGLRNAVIALGDVAAAIISYILSPEGIKTVADAGISLAGALIQGIGMGLGQLAGGLAEALQRMFAGVLDSILAWFGIERNTLRDAMNEMVFENVDGEQITGRVLNAMIASGETTVTEKARAWCALVEAGFAQEANALDMEPAAVALASAVESGMLSMEEQVTALAALIAAGVGTDTVLAMCSGISENGMDLYIAAMDLAEQLYEGTNEGMEAIWPLLAALGISIPQTMAEAIGEDGWQPMVDSASSGMQSVMDAASQVTAQGAQLMTTSTASAIAEGYQNAIPGMQSAMQGAVDTAVAGAETTNAQNMAKADAKSILDAAAGGMTAGSEALTAAANTVVSSAAAAVAGMPTAFATAGEQSATKLTETLTSCQTAVTEAITNLTAQGTTLQGQLTLLITAITTEFAVLQTQIPATMDATFAALAVSVTAGTAAQKLLTETLVTTVTTAYTPVLEKLKGITVNAMLALENVWTIHSPIIASQAALLETNVYNALLPWQTQLPQIAADAMTGVNTALGTGGVTASATASSAAQNIVSSVKGELSYSTGYSIGQDLMNGLKAGIESLSSVVSSAASASISKVTTGMKKAARIRSPSRETEEIGAYLDEGLAIGLSGGLAALAAAEAMADTISAMTDGAYLEMPAMQGQTGTIRRARAGTVNTVDGTMQAMDPELARAIGDRIADRIIERGALSSDIYMDGEKVGARIASPVSREIASQARQGVGFRSAQGVLG